MKSSSKQKLGASSVQDENERLRYVLTSLGEIGHELLSEAGFRSVSKTALRGVLGAIGISKGALFVYDSERRTLSPSVWFGAQKQLPKISLSDRVHRFLKKADRPLLIGGDRNIPQTLIRRNADLAALVPQVWVPLIVQNLLQGVLILGQRFTGASYTSEDLALIWTIAPHFAVGLYNQQLVVETREANFQLNRKLVELETLYDASLALGDSLQVEDVIDDLLMQSVSLVDARSGCVFIRQTDTRPLALVHQVGLSEDQEEKLTSPAVRRRLHRVRKNENVHVFPQTWLSSLLGFQSGLAAPLGGMGVLVVFDKEDRQGVQDFTESDVHLLEMMGRQAGSALSNARLYNDILDVKNYNANILSSIGNGVITTDLKGCIVQVNPSVRRIFGEDAVPHGKSCAQFFINNGCQSIAQAIRASLKDGQSRQIGGEVVPVYSLTLNARIAALRDDADQIQGLVIALEDLTRERRIKEESERKSRFLSAISHELRTPLTAIKGFANNLLDGIGGDLSDRQKRGLSRIDENSVHMLNMVNDLLDLARIEAGRIDIQPVDFDVADVIVGCCETVTPLIKPGVTLKKDIADDIGHAHTDAGRVRQILINLLSNALKFTDGGHVCIGATRDGDRLVLSVSDTGTGIPREDLLSIFEEFKQVKGSDPQHKGTGLGLPITKGFAELLGGAISVESAVGKGSAFTVRLPAEYPA